MAGAMVVRELLTVMGFKTDKKGMKAYKVAVKNLKSTMRDATREAAYLAAGAAAVAFGLAAATKATADQGDEAAKLSKALALTVEEYQEYLYLLKLGGVTQREMSTGFRTGLKNLEMYTRGTGEAKDALKDLEISVSDITNPDGGLKSMPELLAILSDSFKGMTNEAQRTVYAQQIFGRSGTAMIPTLLEGADGIARLREQARSMGHVLSAETAKASEEFNDELERVKTVLTGVRNTIGQAFMPALHGLALGFREWFQANREVMAQRLEDWVDKIRRRFEQFLAALKRVDDFVNRRLGGWGTVIDTVAASATALGAAFATWRVLSVVIPLLQAMGAALGVVGAGSMGAGLLVVLGVLSAIAASVATATALWGGLYVVLEDVAYWMSGNDSALMRLQQSLKGMGPVGAAFAGLMDEIRLALGESATFINEVFLSAMAGIEGIFYDAYDGAIVLGQGIDWLLGKLGELIGIDLGTLESFAVGAINALSGSVRATRGRDRETNRQLRGRREQAQRFVEGRRQGLSRDSAGKYAAPITPSGGVSNTNTFNISGTSPQEAAREIQRVLDQQNRALLAHAQGGDR